ncbi:hypothetical protein DH2020_022586 [Rehmannia glutinosa]|uniref:Uncharacterized protein n=1 Tax=Rehmannia glutinosa TaxID=99300 RepID=A0ABR0W3K5_REHGL
MWMSTQPIDDVSLVAATRTGFLQLFDYIQGKNDNQQKIEMTEPKKPPSAKGLHLQKWGLTYVAVRQFGGFVADEDVGEEAAALYASVAGTVWSMLLIEAIQGRVQQITLLRSIIPHLNLNRVNEIWLTFDMDFAI